MIYLMIKTHRDTGKKYLCKKQTDADEKAIKYKGSGLFWKRFITEHESEIDTEILFKCQDDEKQLFRETGIKCSKELDILNPPFMNLIIEEGQGGSRSETNGTKGKSWIYKGEERKVVPKENVQTFIESGWSKGFPENARKLMSERNKGKSAWNKGKKLKQDHEYVSRTKKRKHRLTHGVPYTTEERRKTSFECLNRPEVLAKFKAPRKSLITAQHTETLEIKTLGRNEWWYFDKVHYKRLLKGRVSKGWKVVVV